MMKKKIQKQLIFFMLIGIISALLTMPVSAEEEILYSYGRVVSIGQGQIVVAEYDYDADTDINLTYSLDPSVELLNIASLKDLKPDDSIEFDFVVTESGNKIVALNLEE